LEQVGVSEKLVDGRENQRGTLPKWEVSCFYSFAFNPRGARDNVSKPPRHKAIKGLRRHWHQQLNKKLLLALREL